MSAIEPGWYKDPADPSTQRYWDGEGWLGEPIPADADPPAQPPAPYTPPPPPPARTDPELTDPDATTLPPVTGLPGATLPGVGAPPTGAGHPGTIGRPGTTPGLPPGLPFPPSMPMPPGISRGPAGPGFVLATPGARFAARILDILAVLVLAAAANWIFALRWWHSFQPWANQVSALADSNDVPPLPDDVRNLTLIIIAVLTAVWFAYEVPSSANSGQTLGKRLVGIKVMRLESAERLGFGRSWRRWSRLGLPTLLWWCCGLGFVIQLMDCLSVAVDQPLHQAIHDKVAQTVVVRAGRTPKGPTTVQVGAHDDRSDPPQS